MKKQENPMVLLSKIPVLVTLANAIAAYVKATTVRPEPSAKRIGREVETLSFHMLRDGVKRLASEVHGSTLLFRADCQRRRAMSEANRKAYLCGMNNDIGKVEVAEDVWYSADDQRYMPLVSAVSWKAEMDGYSIFDPGEDTGILWEEKMEQTQIDGNACEIPAIPADYEETKGQRPGARSEIMNLFTPFEAGPYSESFNVDPTDVGELLDEGWDIITALEWAEDIAPPHCEPLTIGYEANVEDQAMLVDLEYSRGYCDAEDSRDACLAYRKELSRKGPTGICSDRARFMRNEATRRNDRFIRELSFIAGANPKAIRARYSWAKDPAKRGKFWRTVDSYSARNPEPGLTWLTRSHTILLNFAYRRRLGIKVSDGMAKAAFNAADNIAEQMKKHCEISDFNLADVEGHVNGHTEYFEYLGKFYASQR